MGIDLFIDTLVAVEQQVDSQGVALTPFVTRYPCDAPKARVVCWRTDGTEFSWKVMRR